MDSLQQNYYGNHYDESRDVHNPISENNVHGYKAHQSENDPDYSHYEDSHIKH